MKHTILGISCLLLMGLSLQGCGLFKSDLDKLLETKECQECDLSGANLEGASLKWVNMTGANLTGANLTGAYLIEASLSNANLTKATLTGTDLVGAQLTKANLTNTDLTKANLEYSINFTTADTTGATFCRTIMPDGSMNKSGC